MSLSVTFIACHAYIECLSCLLCSFITTQLGDDFFYAFSICVSKTVYMTVVLTTRNRYQ